MADYRLTQSGEQVQEILNTATPQSSLTAETERAQGAEQTLQNNIDTEESQRKAADNTLQQNIDSEAQTRQQSDATLQQHIDAEALARGNADTTLQGNIDAEQAARIADVDAEETRAKAAEKQNADDIDAEEAARIAADNAINAKIPAAASAQNQLADKQFVNQSIQTATAVFRGTYNLVSDLHLEVGASRADIIAALGATISGADNNDYCFVQIPTATATPTEIAAIDRYKFNGSAWAFEYTLNNSGFTAAQWDAINSTITSGLVAKLSALPTNSELTTLLAGKQAVIQDLETIRSGAAAGATAYQKPGAGIPKTDLASGVQTSLQKADDAAPQATTYTKTQVDGLVGDEETRARAAEQANATDIDTIEGKIPVAASSSNQLADKNFVNSSIATNTANFKGSYNEVSDLQLTPAASRADIATALAGTITGADNNDYAFVQIPTAVGTPTEIARVERYKYNGSAWAFEYELNNSGFTAAQWEAINSTITSGLVAKLSALPTNSELTTLLAGKQDVIADLQTIRSQAGAAAPQATTYTKQETDAAIDADVLVEETRAKAAEKQNADNIDAIEEKIPAAASSSNQLADKAFVNSSIATNTATFRGAYNLVSDLSLTTAATQSQIGTALAGEISTADNNDYAFVQIPTADATPTVIARVDRYKFDGTDWSFEYSLNNSGFTAAQWDAINSAITSGLVTKLTNLPTNAELEALLNGKQAVIADLSDIRSGAAAGATAYQKPVGGIPDTDLTAALQAQIASFITKAVSDLTNYYLKSDTYNKNEVDQMVAAIKQFELVSVQTLPTASANTMGKLYFVPSADPQTQNVKDEFITLSTTENDTTTYYWECIGSTTLDLTNYYTKTQTDAAITAALNTALASYSTTTQVGTLISTAINSALAAYATKEYVGQQVQEYAGTFRGTYDTLADLEATTGNHHNDYAWVKVTDSDGDNDYDRYKYNGSEWIYEYRLNNTHFTSDELAAIRSGMTTAKREKLDALPTNADLTTALAGKQASITDGVQIGLGLGVCTTDATTAAKVATLANFIMLKNMPVSVSFTKAINCTGATLNINSQGAKPLYIGGNALQPGVVKAGCTITVVYDGTNWNIICISGLEQSSAPSDLFVDMGLPSGLLWAKKNIDVTQADGFAASEYQYECTFFSWGNTQGHNPSSSSAFSYDWGSSNDGPYASTPGAALNGNVPASMDFARANLGAPWRLPTTDEYAELFNSAYTKYIDANGDDIAAETTNKLTTMSGITGIRLKSKVNNNILFFPCSGNGNGSAWSSRGSGGHYWSGSLYSAPSGRHLHFSSGGVHPQDNDYRFYGFAGRAVQ